MEARRRRPGRASANRVPRSDGRHDDLCDVVQPDGEVLGEPAPAADRLGDVPAVHGDLQGADHREGVAAEREVADARPARR